MTGKIIEVSFCQTHRYTGSLEVGKDITKAEAKTLLEIGEYANIDLIDTELDTYLRTLATLTAKLNLSDDSGFSEIEISEAITEAEAIWTNPVI